jgi:type III pantothenate kinase
MSALIAVSVGNTRTRMGLFVDGQIEPAVPLENGDVGAIAGAILGLHADAPVVMASVNDAVAGEIERRVAQARGEVARFGRDLSIPIRNTLDDDSTVGQDRLLNALGAWSKARQAIVVVDCGTAMTVDFVDGEGIFQGGAIGPGLNMMLRALHDQTAALPAVTFEASPVVQGEADAGVAFGKDTRRAMLLGVQSAAQGMMRVLVERYATAYGGYPQVVATGGDARTLFENDDLVEHIVPDLTLLGIEAAVRLLAEE